MTQKAPSRFKSALFLLILLLIPTYILFQTQIGAHYYVKANCHQQCKTEWDSFGAYIPTGYTVYGIDISHHSCQIDWDEVRKMQVNGVGIQFAYMRSTKGYDADYLFGQNWKDAKSSGMIRGAYHYYKPLLDPEKQADKFLKTFKLLPGDLPPVLDIEEGNGIKDEFVIKGMTSWLEIVEYETGVRPMIYTNLYYYKKYIANRFPHYPIWIAGYGISRINLPDARPWRFWQFSETGRANGICEKIDLNAFIGTYQQLLSLCAK